MPDLFAAADALADMSNALAGKANPLPIRQQREWEQRALTVFTRIYAAQRKRIMDGISEEDRLAIWGAVQRLFAGEPERVKREVVRLFDELGSLMRDAAIGAIGGAGVDVDAVLAAQLATSRELAALVGKRISDTSRDLTLSIVQDWLDTPEQTIGDLRKRLVKVWEGPRPNAAARTEITRLNTRIRAATWEASGLVWGYNVVTRNDGLVRPTHTEVAQGSPYPLSDTDHRPPINDDINCRCSTLPYTLAQAIADGRA